MQRRGKRAITWARLTNPETWKKANHGDREAETVAEREQYLSYDPPKHAAEVELVFPHEFPVSRHFVEEKSDELKSIRRSKRVYMTVPPAEGALTIHALRLKSAFDAADDAQFAIETYRQDQDQRASMFAICPQVPLVADEKIEILDVANGPPWHRPTIPRRRAPRSIAMQSNEGFGTSSELLDVIPKLQFSSMAGFRVQFGYIDLEEVMCDQAKYSERDLLRLLRRTAARNTVDFKVGMSPVSVLPKIWKLLDAQGRSQRVVGSESIVLEITLGGVCTTVPLVPSSVCKGQFETGPPRAQLLGERNDFRLCVSCPDRSCDWGIAIRAQSHDAPVPERVHQMLRGIVVYGQVGRLGQNYLSTPRVEIGHLSGLLNTGDSVAVVRRTRLALFETGFAVEFARASSCSDVAFRSWRDSWELGILHSDWDEALADKQRTDDENGDDVRSRKIEDPPVDGLLLLLDAIEVLQSTIDEAAGSTQP